MNNFGAHNWWYNRLHTITPSHPGFRGVAVTKEVAVHEPEPSQTKIPSKYRGKKRDRRDLW